MFRGLSFRASEVEGFAVYGEGNVWSLCSAFKKSFWTLEAHYASSRPFESKPKPQTPMSLNPEAAQAFLPDEVEDEVHGV